MPGEASGTAQGNSGIDTRALVSEIMSSIQSTGNGSRSGGDTVNDKVIRDNVKLRLKLNEVRTENETLKSKLPEGAVVLSKDDAKLFEDFKALGKKPADITKLLKDGETAATELASRKLGDVAADAAKALGWNGVDVLKDQISSRNLRVEMRETEVDDGKGGKTKKPVPFVITGEGAASKAEELTTYVNTNLKGYLPALQGSADSNGDRRAASSTSGGVRVPAQTAAAQTSRAGTSINPVAAVTGRYIRPSQVNPDGSRRDTATK